MLRRLPLSLPVLLLSLVFVALGPPRRAEADTVALDGNFGFVPEFLQWCLACPAVGWYLTPAADLPLTGFQTKFRGLFQAGAEDRSVTFEVLTERRDVPGASLLASASFDSGAARDTWSGVNFPKPLLLEAGKTYFLGFRNVQGLGTNVTQNPAATVLPPGLYLDTDGVNDGSYSVYAGAATPAALGAPLLRLFRATDVDADLLLDPEDNCPTVANAGQADANADGVGDACADVSVPREPNETPAQATPVPCGFTSSGAAISPLGDLDYYRFEAAAGTIVAVDLDAQIEGSSLDSEMGLFGPDGTRLTFSAGNPAPGEDFGDDSYFQAVLPTGGTWSVGVSSFPDRDVNGGDFFTSGPYTLRLTCSPPDPYEPNDTLPTASDLPCPGATTNAQIAPASDVDVYRIPAASGSRIVVDVDSDGIDSRVTLRSSSGSTVAFNDDGQAPGEPVSKDSYLSYDVPAPGTYTVAVESFLSAGPYTLTVSCGSSDPNEPNGSLATAAPLSCNSATASGTQLNPVGDVDFFQVTLPERTTIALDLDPAGRFRPNLEDSTLGLFDAAGKVAWLSDDGRGKNEDPSLTTVYIQDSFLLQTLPAGTHRFAVSSWDDYDFDGVSDSGAEPLGGGEYVLDLRCTALPPNPIPGVPWRDADDGAGGNDDAYGEHELPFVFPYKGRSITRIASNSNGVLELLEAGEECKICDRPRARDYAVATKSDLVYGADGDLVTGILLRNGPDRFRSTWIGSAYGESFAADTTIFEVSLHKDGRVRWKFFRMDAKAAKTGLFAGLHDGVTGVALGIPGGIQSLSGAAHRAFEYVPGAASIVEIPWDANETELDVADDAGLELALPFTMPFSGRQIQKIHLNTNGLVELMQAGESCAECSDPNTHALGHHATEALDAIFAANDDLVGGAIVRSSPRRVEIDWIAHTKSDGTLDENGLAFGVTLTPGGDLQWRFSDMPWNGFSGDLFSGLYDGVAGKAYEVETRSQTLYASPQWKAFARGTDGDGDGIPNAFDNCSAFANPSQRDTDGDFVGNDCDGDFNQDGLTNFSDLARLRQVFFGTDPHADLDGSGVVNFADLARFRGLFLKPPGPSGQVPAD